MKRPCTLLATGLAPVAASRRKNRAEETLPHTDKSQLSPQQFYGAILFISWTSFFWNYMLNMWQSLPSILKSYKVEEKGVGVLESRHSIPMSSCGKSTKGPAHTSYPRESLAALAMTSTLNGSTDDEDGTRDSETHRKLKSIDKSSGVRAKGKKPELLETDNADVNEGLEFHRLGHRQEDSSDSMSDINSLGGIHGEWEGLTFDNDYSLRNSDSDSETNYPNYTTKELIQGVICIPSISSASSSPTSIVNSIVDSVSRVTSTELSRLLQTRQWENAMEQLEQAHIEIDIQVPRLGKCRGYPLHLACLYQPTPSVIRRLLDVFPEAVRIAKDYTCHQLPLHFACMSSASKEVIQLLLQAYPRGVKCRETYAGFLPLHLACYKEAPLYIIEELVAAYPEALQVEDNFGETPIDIVRKRENDLSSINLVQFLEQSLSNLIFNLNSESGAIRDFHYHCKDRVVGEYDVCFVGVYLRSPSPKIKIKDVARSFLGPRPINTFIAISVPDLHLGTPTRSWKTVYRSPTVYSSPNPIWTTSGLNLEFLCNGEFSMAVKVDVIMAPKRDPNSNSLSKPVAESCGVIKIGSVETTFQQLLDRKCAFMSRDPKSMKAESFVLRSRGEKTCGHLVVLDRIQNQIG